MRERRLKLSELAEELDVPKTTIHLALTEGLGMKKVSAHWVPKLLSPYEKQDRVEICSQNLELLEDNWKPLHTLITGDNTWVYYYAPEARQQSMQWKHEDSPPSKNAKVTKSAKKLMLTVFRDAKGPLLINVMERNTTINVQAYAETLNEPRLAMEEKRGVAKTMLVKILHDNAPVHTAQVCRSAMEEPKLDPMIHPPRITDMFLSYY